MMDTRYGDLTPEEHKKLDAYIVELNKSTHDGEPLGKTAEGGVYIVAFKESLIKRRLGVEDEPEEPYDYSGLVVTGKALLEEGHEIDQAVIADLRARIEVLEREQREQKKQLGE